MKKYILLSLIAIGCFGAENAKAAPTFDEVLGWIEEAESSPFEICENGIILLGASGEAKSSLMNLLAENLPVQTTDSSDQEIASPAMPTPQTAEIIALKTQDGTLLWDCSSFFDMTGLREKFISAFKMYKLIQNTENARIVLVIDKGILATRGIADFIQLVTKLRAIFNGNLKDCATIVITKTYPGTEPGTLELLKRNISNQLRVLNRLGRIPKATEDKKSCKLISTLLEDRHIAFSPSLTEEGTEMSKKRADLMGIINQSKRATFESKPSSAVSNDIALYVHSMKDGYEQRLRELVIALTKTVNSTLLDAPADRLRDILQALESNYELSALEAFIEDETEAIRFKDNCDTIKHIISLAKFISTIKGVPIDLERYSEKQHVKHLCEKIKDILNNSSYQNSENCDSE